MRAKIHRCFSITHMHVLRRPVEAAPLSGRWCRLRRRSVLSGPQRMSMRGRL